MIQRKVFIWNFGLLILFLLGIEFILRIYRPPLILLRIKMNQFARIVPSDKEVSNEENFDDKRFRFKPNSFKKVLHQEYNYVAKHDQYGWRSPCFDKDKNADFFVVGDSFVYGIGVRDENTFSCSFSQKDINAYTLGIPGVGPRIYFKIIKNNQKLIEQFSIKNKSKLLTFIFTGNDFEEFLNYKIFEESKFVSNEDKNSFTFLAKSKLFIKAKLIQLNNQVVYQNVLNLGESYLLAGLKISLQNLRGPDNENMYKMYSGSSFYLKNTELPINKLKIGLKNYLYALEQLNIDHLAFVLIPDPSEVYEDRLHRDSKLRRVSVDNIDNI